MKAQTMQITFHTRQRAKTQKWVRRDDCFSLDAPTWHIFSSAIAAGHYFSRMKMLIGVPL